MANNITDSNSCACWNYNIKYEDKSGLVAVGIVLLILTTITYICIKNSPPNPTFHDAAFFKIFYGMSGGATALGLIFTLPCITIQKPPPVKIEYDQHEKL